MRGRWVAEWQLGGGVAVEDGVAYKCRFLENDCFAIYTSSTANAVPLPLKGKADYSIDNKDISPTPLTVAAEPSRFKACQSDKRIKPNPPLVCGKKC